MQDSVASYLNIKPEQLISEYGGGYENTQMHWSVAMSRARPYFNYYIIDEMVMDPRIIFGLLLIKGPLQSNARFGVTAETPEAEEYIISELNRFWNRAINKVLEGIEWGFSSGEVVYSFSNDGNYLQFEEINNFNAKDVSVVSVGGKRVGINIRNVKSYGFDFNQIYLGGPKHFHYVHWRKYNKHYGRSRLWSTLVPWWEIWSKGGYRDIRRLWFAKNAFSGGLMRYPKGKTKVPGYGEKENHDLAMEIATKMMTGHVAVAPNSKTSSMKEGEYDWMFNEVKANNVPGGLFQYGDILRIEILESMGIPYEVIESSGNEGFGSSTGRMVPLEAYYSILYEIMSDIINDWRCQIMDFLLMHRYRRKIEYEVHPLPLQTTEQSQEDPATTEEDDADAVKTKSGSQQSEPGEDSEQKDQPQEAPVKSDPKPKAKTMGVAKSLSN